MKNIIFLCIENSNRSQMAEAFAHLYGKNKVNPYSAGSQPLGKINPKAIEAMKTFGYDLTKHQSKSVNDFRNIPFEYIITMGCGDQCPYIPAKYREDWNIPDPKNMEMKDFITICKIIEVDVKLLLDKIKD